MSGRIGRRAYAAIAAAAAVAGPLAGGASGQPATREVRMPTEADAVAFAVGAQTILYGVDGIESQLPGPVADVERVRLGLASDGSLQRITITQRLTITGLGDFRFRVPGPAATVVPLPESESEPGLRRGSVIWQGFSDGEKVLAARMELFPDQERIRLPLVVEIDATVDGRPFVAGTPATGDFRLEVRVRNVSAIPLGTTDAVPADPDAVGRALDALAGELGPLARPKPGSAGIPKAVVVHEPVRDRREPIEAAFSLIAQVTWDDPALSSVEAPGSALKAPGDVLFATTVGGGHPDEVAFTLTGRARDLAGFGLLIDARPALPKPEVVTPPAGGSWRAALRSGAADPREAFLLLQDTLWRVARLRQYDAYLGNPDPTGPATAQYRFVLEAPAAGPAVTPGPATGGANPVAIALWSAAALVAAFGLALAWSRA